MLKDCVCMSYIGYVPAEDQNRQAGLAYCYNFVEQTMH